MPVIRRVVFATLLGIFVLAFVAPLPLDMGSSDMENVSALFHVVAYAVLTGGAICRYRSRAIDVACAILLFGTVLESTQYFVPGRYFGVFDLLANASGVFGGAAIAALAARWHGIVKLFRPVNAIPLG